MTHARHYRTGRLVRLDPAGRVVAVESTPAAPDLPVVAPSFFDVQINGCLGVGFVDPDLTPDGVRTVADECRRHGIGGFLPTLITHGFERLRDNFAVLGRALDTDPELAARIPGFHLEGPYLSGDDGPRGAHPKEHVRDPDWDEFRRWQDAAGGRIRMVTVAPERAGALDFIRRLTASGVVVALGHTAADGPTIWAAAAAGAQVSTHLGNGCAAVLPRHPNVIWEQLACDALWASVIADGHHVPPSLLAVAARCKPGRLLLTCDAGTLAGLPAGRYASSWGQELEVQGGRIVVPGTPYLAGSAAFTDTCVAVMARQAGVSLADAIDMASVRPRELLGLPVPGVETGAEVVVVRPDDPDQDRGSAERTHFSMSVAFGSR